ncbi:PDC2 [Candida pseudojiufengensis]|uniref:PDC2 n=1 Tax=Candida pseudojiufengensis TaxID=497109 RepID=UPI00222540A1|nr:PDC2 [Candida pseudojiufengensis]KAI5962401.1 PDC2 [Candida pseudojiufengensis]
MTQSDLAVWAMKEYGSKKPPSQTTISRILSSKNDLIASKEGDFKLVRRRKQTNPLLRKILTEWVTQAIWENIPITTPIIQSTAHAIWTRLPQSGKTGNGVFNAKWCSHFMKKLNINITGDEQAIKNNLNYKLNKVWKLDEKIELKQYLEDLIIQNNYSPQDIFVLDEFQIFYELPLDQIFNVSSLDKGLPQSHSSNQISLTLLLGCNIDGSEKLSPMIVGKYDKFDVSKSSIINLKSLSIENISYNNLMNKLTEYYNIFYKSNKNKWITSQMFQNYLLTLDHKLHNLNSKRKILIILDDCSSHRIINLNFQHLKLVYLKNETCHKNPYNTNFSGIKFDYLPMNFGIIEEFKILYRKQQYEEMINLQRYISRGNKLNQYEFNTTTSTPPLEVLSEQNYHIPLIKVIEWINNAWNQVSKECIYQSWKKTHLLKLKENQTWPSQINKSYSNNIIQKLNENLIKYDSLKNFKQLESLMTYLNVVIPWEIDELIGLVNERGKITLSYASIEEIIDSCLSESINDEIHTDFEIDDIEQDHEYEQEQEQEHEESHNDIEDEGFVEMITKEYKNSNRSPNSSNNDQNNWTMIETDSNNDQNNNNNKILSFENSLASNSENGDSINVDNDLENKIINSFPFETNTNTTCTTNITNSLKHKLENLENNLIKNKRHAIVSNQQLQYQNYSIYQPQPQPSLPSQPPLHQSSLHQHQLQHSSNNQIDIIQSLIKILNYTNTNQINLSQSTIDDLNYNLRNFESRLNRD